MDGGKKIKLTWKMDIAREMHAGRVGIVCRLFYDFLFQTLYDKLI